MAHLFQHVHIALCGSTVDSSAIWPILAGTIDDYCEGQGGQMLVKVPAERVRIVDLEDSPSISNFKYDLFNST